MRPRDLVIGSSRLGATNLLFISRNPNNMLSAPTSWRGTRELFKPVLFLKATYAPSRHTQVSARQCRRADEVLCRFGPRVQTLKCRRVRQVASGVAEGRARLGRTCLEVRDVRWRRRGQIQSEIEIGNHRLRTFPQDRPPGHSVCTDGTGRLIKVTS